jgi:hypothetical protein
VDKDETIDALRKGQDLPLSVVFVGVGGSDDTTFAQIQSIVGEYRVDSINRDFVRFVRYDDAQAATISTTALQDIPNQMVSYFTSHGVYPQPQQEVEDIVVEPYVAAAAVQNPVEIDPKTGKPVLVPIPLTPVQEGRAKRVRFFKQGLATVGRNIGKGVTRQVKRQVNMASTKMVGFAVL